VKNSGGAAAVIYNNVSGGFAGTLNGSSTIPAISISMEDGTALKAYLNQSATASNTSGAGSGYAYYDGTSMATPHVSGVAALVWSNAPTKTNAALRAALQATAEDLGPVGRDNAYGYGLVRAKAALDYLNGAPPPNNNAPTASFTFDCSQLSCVFTDTSTDLDGTISAWNWTFGDTVVATSKNPSHTYANSGTYTVRLTVTDDDAATSWVDQQVTVSGTTAGITLSARGYKVKGVKTVDLTWSGGATPNVDIYRNATLLTSSTANDGAYTDKIVLKGGGTYSYRVCEAGSTSACSNTAQVAF